MTTLKLGLLGFGNVLRHFAELLPEKAATLKARYDLDLVVVGIATHSHGIAINPKGIDLLAAVHEKDISQLHTGKAIESTEDFIRACPADIILEGTWVNMEDGQPATDFCRIALESGKHVVTANKAPVVFGYRHLKALADAQNLAFFFESTVMDGVPIHSLAREGLPGAEVLRIRGVLNSTTNAILTAMEEGESFEDALQELQEAGIAEANPANDIDGWDSAIKIAILANTLMGADLRPADVFRTGIREVTNDDLQDAALDGTTIKLVCEAHRDQNGLVVAQVAPEPLEPDDPLTWLDSTASAVTIETDIIDSITVRESPASPRTTAYGMLVDVINIARGRR